MRHIVHFCFFISFVIAIACTVWPLGSVYPVAYLTAALVFGALFFLSLPCMVLDLNPFLSCTVAAVLVINCLVSVESYLGVLETIKILSLLMVGMWFYQIRNTRFVNIFLTLLTILGVFYALYGIAQWKGFYGHDYWAQPNQVSSRLVNSTHFAGFLIIPLMSALGLLFSSAAITWKLLPLLSLPILGKSLLLTQSRSGWICFLFSGVCYLFFMLKRRWKALAFNKKIPVMVFLVCAAAVFLYGIHGAVYQRIAILLPTKFQTLTQRLQVFQTSLLIILNHPMGIGGGGLFRVSSQFKTVSDRFLIDYAHNELLQVTIEYGILGLLAVFILFFSYQKTMSRFLRTMEENAGLLSPYASLHAATLGLFAQSLVDFPLRIPCNAFLLSAIVGFQLGMARTSSGMGMPTMVSGFNRFFNMYWLRKTLTGMFLSSTLIFLVWVERLRESEVWLSHAREAMKSFSWGEGRAWYERGSRLAPSSPYFSCGMGELLLARSIITKDKQPFLKEAARFFDNAFSKSSKDGKNLLNLAEVHNLLGEIEYAECFYKLAIQANPQVRKPYLHLGYFLLDHGKYEEAALCLRRSIYLPCCEDSLAGLDKVLERFYTRTQDYTMLRKAIPSDVNTLISLALFLHHKGDKPGFDRAAGEALDMSSNKLEVAFRFFQLANAAGDQVRAERFGKAVLEMDPGNAGVKNILTNLGR